MQKTNHLLHLLKTRHILMIALGSAIGTGLFFGSGESIHLAGPSILLSFAIGGLIMYIVVRALGEMIVHEPNSGSFSYYAYRYVGHYTGFLTGWNYWFNYIIVCMLELTASTIFLDYWFPHIPHWIVALIILVIFAAINLLGIMFFAEFEFWLAGIKIITIIAMIILGIYIIFFANTNYPGASIKNLWHYGGFFTGGLHGFFCSFVVVVFAFGGTELVGIAAAEAKNPSRTVPLAINGIIFRIIVFYLATLAIIMCLYPWNQINSNLSPFVDVFNKIGIPKAAGLMNLVAITAALSSLNSGIYGTARMLFNLGTQHNAPKVLTHVNKRGIPYIATIVSLICILFTVLLNYLYPKHVFNILLAIATIAAILNWLAILFTHWVFRHKVPLKYIKYKTLLFPISSILAIVFFIVVIGTMINMPDMRLSLYIAPAWILLLSLGYYIKQKL